MKKTNRWSALWIGVLALALLLPYPLYLWRDQDFRFAQKLGPGWNLGNSLDSHGLGAAQGTPERYETFWQNPPASRQLMARVRAAGFQSVRIPVTWYEHLDADGGIDAAWLRRVREVVDDALAEGLYVVLNLHHENWSVPTYQNREAGGKRLENIWSQLADAFERYDERLLFEGLNEPRLVGRPEEWLAGTPEAWEVVGGWNELFVKTVRSAGGKNKARYLLLPTYCNSFAPDAVNAFRLPKGKRLIATVHAYTPVSFALLEDGTAEWSAARDRDTAPIDQLFATLRSGFIDKRIPVVIGEFGAIDKQNELDRAEWAGYFIEGAAKNRIPCFWWDDGRRSDRGDRFTLIDRATLESRHPILLEKVVNAYGKNR